MSIQAQLQEKLYDRAVEVADEGQFLKACKMFEQSGKFPEEQIIHADKFAHGFYRRALHHQSHQDEFQAVNDLEKALKFPNVHKAIKTLIQQRITVIRNGSIPETKKFDKAIEKRFGKYPSEDDLLQEFIQRFGLSQASRVRNIEGIHEIASIGVYRWAGDANRHEQWSKLIRKSKAGETGLPAFWRNMLAGLECVRCGFKKSIMSYQFWQRRIEMPRGV